MEDNIFSFSRGEKNANGIKEYIDSSDPLNPYGVYGKYNTSLETFD
jgi:hypothetical protein